MKKFFYVAAALLTLGFVSCGDDSSDTETPSVAAVTNLKATAESETSVVLTWTNPSGDNFSNVKISYKREGSNASTPQEVEAGASTYTVNGLSYVAGKPYTFTVQSFGVDGKGGKSATVKANPLEENATPIAAVSGLQYTAARGAVNLTWEDPSDNRFYGVKIAYTTPVDGDVEVIAYAGDGADAGFQIGGLLKKWGEIAFTLTSINEEEEEGESTTINAQCLRAELVGVEYREDFNEWDGKRSYMNIWSRPVAIASAWSLGYNQDEAVKNAYCALDPIYHTDRLKDGDLSTYSKMIENWDYIYNDFSTTAIWAMKIQPWIQIDLVKKKFVDNGVTFKGIDVTFTNPNITKAESTSPYWGIEWDVYVCASPDRDPKDSETNWTDNEIEPNEAKASEVLYPWIQVSQGVNTAGGMAYSASGYSDADYEKMKGHSFTFRCIKRADNEEFYHIRMPLRVCAGNGTGLVEATDDPSVKICKTYCSIAEVSVALVNEYMTDPESDTPDKQLTQAEIDEIESEFQ